MCINFSSDVIIMYFFASHLNPILQMRSVFNTFKVTKPLLNLILYSDHHAVGRAPTQAIRHHTDDALHLAGARNRR